ncbi:hypothetical protein ACFJGW_15055 [Burkholderiaceae bacterium UC74_6]
MQASAQRPRSLPLRVTSAFSKPTEDEFVRCWKIVKRMLETMREESSAPVRVERVRRTRTGWAAIYRIGDRPRGAFKIDTWDDEPRSLSPEQAVAHWASGS